MNDAIVCKISARQHQARKSAGQTQNPISEPHTSTNAFCSLTQSAWAREFHDEKITADKSHHNTLRTPSNRWLEILWHRLTNGVPYEEATHQANRKRALGHAA
jgi:hypothetical protein